jgi:hypothetical protein
MRREPFLIVVLVAGCARSSADLLDASFGPSTGADSGTADDEAVTDSSDGDDPDDGEDIDGPDPDGTDLDGTDSVPDDQDDGLDADSGDADDGPLDGDDMSAEDAGTQPVDSGTGPQPIVADFKVRQRNAALHEPIGTNLELKVGDRLRIQGSGQIYPGLFLQGCCGPAGTSGKHEGPEWPLQGGPDFALVAFVNGAWEYVGPDTTFDIEVAGTLLLGTNDDDPSTGDDCTSAEPNDRGFSARVIVTPAP